MTRKNLTNGLNTEIPREKKDYELPTNCLVGGIYNLWGEWGESQTSNSFRAHDRQTILTSIVFQ